MLSPELNDKQFRDSMSQGFSALFENKFSSASKAFSQALEISPKNDIASNAYRQAIASDKRASLSVLAFFRSKVLRIMSLGNEL